MSSRAMDPITLKKSKHTFCYCQTAYEIQGRLVKVSCHCDLLDASATDLQDAMTFGEVTSVQLVSLYLDQIYKYESYLKAMIDIAPEDQVFARANGLDEERCKGHIRSKLHGIPILIKDNIATCPSMGMRTTAGNFALALSTCAGNAPVIDRILEAGAIILGKASLSELSSFKGMGLPQGWSALRGQGQSPYVRGGVDPTDTSAGHSNPEGSSSGSAIGVAAGYAPIALGTETEGSLIMPSARHALYTIKPTVGSVSVQGVVPITAIFDAVGPMTKTVKDLADLLEVIFEPSQLPQGGFGSSIVQSWAGLRIVTLDPEVWSFDESATRPSPGANEQMVNEVRAAYKRLSELADFVQEDTEILQPDMLMLDGENVVHTMICATHEKSMNGYLKTLVNSHVRSLDDLVSWNKAHATLELPINYTQQDLLEKSVGYEITKAQYDRVTSHMMEYVREEGINKVLGRYQADVILAPAESLLTAFASAAGYPIASLPVGYLDFNGRPHGLAALARAHHESTLIQVMSAWEATFPSRQPPDLSILPCPQA